MAIKDAKESPIHNIAIASNPRIVYHTRNVIISLSLSFYSRIGLRVCYVIYKISLSYLTLKVVLESWQGIM